MKKSELIELIKQTIPGVLKEYYKPQINIEKETISFANSADSKKAGEELKAKNIKFNVVFGKTLKFVNTVEFKKAKSILGIK